MKTILVPIDFSDVTPHVLEQAKQIAPALGAELHLVHVREVNPVAPPTTFGYGVTGMPELMPMPTTAGMGPVPLETPVNERNKAKLAAWQKEISNAGLKATLHEPAGVVVEEILREADALDPSMIVMGRHGHGAMYNLLVGSVTEGVLKRSKCPVLLVPSARS
jgi:nucleotide-binding universal stress UspA family protein